LEITMTVGHSMTEVVGHTPVVQLRKVVPEGAADVFVKLEWFNPTGSYKDRMALAMITEAERRGDLRAGMTVLEYTAGSTGSSLAYVCASKGYHFKVVTSDAFAPEKLATMAALGAELTIVPSVGGKITPDLTPRMIETARALAADPDVYWTDQLNNTDSLVGYHQVGVELLEQLEQPIDVFCCAVGTSGMATGVKNALDEADSSARVVIFEPDSSPVISTGQPGVNSIEGIGIGMVPPMLDLERFDEIRAISEDGAFAMARCLAAEEGLLAGASTGLNVVGAIELAREIGEGKTVVTLACDTGLKYLSGDLYRR
jgi:cysteine synthase